MSIMVVLPAPLGANNVMQFAGCNVQAELVDGLETIKADTNVFKVQKAAVSDVNFARGDDAAAAGTAATGFGIFFVGVQGREAFFCTACVLIKQVRCYFCCPATS